MIDNIEITKGITLNSDERTRLMDLDFNAFKDDLKKIADGSWSNAKNEGINPEESARLDRRALSIATNGSRQKVISLNLTVTYINEGFQFINAIPGNKAIVRLP